jgi:hypothetical protein
MQPNFHAHPAKFSCAPGQTCVLTRLNFRADPAELSCARRFSPTRAQVCAGTHAGLARHARKFTPVRMQFHSLFSNEILDSAFLNSTPGVKITFKP